MTALCAIGAGAFFPFVLATLDHRADREDAVFIIYIMSMFYLHLAIFIYVVWTQLASGKYDGLLRISDVYAQMTAVQEAPSEYRYLSFVTWYSKRVFWVFLVTLLATAVIAYYLLPTLMSAH